MCKFRRKLENFKTAVLFYRLDWLYHYPSVRLPLVVRLLNAIRCGLRDFEKTTERCRCGL